MTGQGRPALRLAAWRAVWGALKSNPVYAARFAHLTGREHNKLSTGQAHAALAAALLRHLHAIITTGQRWDPAIAAGGRPDQTLNAAWHPARRRPPQAGGRGEPHAASRRAHRDLACHPGQPRPSPDQPDYALPGTIPMTAMQGPATEQGTGHPLDKNALR
jgi:hypothetical protein